MRILLAVACKLLSLLSEKLLEHVRPDCRRLAIPHLSKQLAIAESKAATGSQRIIFVHIIKEQAL